MDKLYQSLRNISISHKLFQIPEGGSTLSDTDQSEVEPLIVILNNGYGIGSGLTQL